MGDVWRVYMLEKAAQLARLAVDYHNLQSFIFEGMYRVQKASARGDLKDDFPETTPEGKEQIERPMKIANKTHDTVCQVLEFRAKRALASSEDEDVPLRAFEEQVGQIVKTDSDFTKTLKTAAGDQSFAFNYHDVWGTYCEHSETDVARAAFKHVVKFIIAAMRHKRYHLAQMVEAIMDILDQAGF